MARSHGDTNLRTREIKAAAEAEAKALAKGALTKAPSRKLGKQVLSDAMHHFLNLAEQHAPSKPEGGDEAKFADYLMKAVDCAGRVAPYESPRLASVTITPSPLDPRLFTTDELATIDGIFAAAAARRSHPAIPDMGRDQGGDYPA